MMEGDGWRVLFGRVHERTWEERAYWHQIEKQDLANGERRPMASKSVRLPRVVVGRDRVTLRANGKSYVDSVDPILLGPERQIRPGRGT